MIKGGANAILSVKHPVPGQVRRQAHEQRYNVAHRLSVGTGLVLLATTLTLKPIFLNWDRYWAFS